MQTENTNPVNESANKHLVVTSKAWMNIEFINNTSHIYIYIPLVLLNSTVK